ncbi:Uncharacterized membrane protein [Caloranaerobacter azorensis DSM 13643]|uniref:Uncharacterized membrane protein n=1 Tax=Caloranaerobacter azorensis DSM 13643 TaxID=1121264 RepID=A0A1M5WPC4_9FIRM|nr:DUF969 domain-containing protein [Caloranaerobacter azorensis]SHH89351.1 Uncharacterized membrane protein [Caloranaerobacter azorensis DSM 13643]
MIKLIGVLIIIIGFILKLDTIAVVLIAGIVTGLVSGLSFGEIFSTLGSAFIKTRYMSLFLVTLPVIGILERYGLRERAAELIKNIKAVTTGKVLVIYTIIRELAAAFSLRLGGHVQFIRPLIFPMAQGAAEANYDNLGEEEIEIIKGYAAASENYGNFFGQNVFIAAGGVLLIVGTLGELGIEVTPLQVSRASIPIAIFAFIYATVQYYILDKKLSKRLNKDKSK